MRPILSVRKCLVCDQNYGMTYDIIDKYFEIQVLHPFFVCEKCSKLEVHELSKELQDKLIELFSKNYTESWEKLHEEFEREWIPENFQKRSRYERKT